MHFKEWFEEQDQFEENWKGKLAGAALAGGALAKTFLGGGADPQQASPQVDPAQNRPAAVQTQDVDQEFWKTGVWQKDGYLYSREIAMNPKVARMQAFAKLTQHQGTNSLSGVETVGTDKSGGMHGVTLRWSPKNQELARQAAREMGN